MGVAASRDSDEPNETQKWTRKVTDVLHGPSLTARSCLLTLRTSGKPKSTPDSCAGPIAELRLTDVVMLTRYAIATDDAPSPGKEGSVLSTPENKDGAGDDHGGARLAEAVARHRAEFALSAKIGALCASALAADNGMTIRFKVVFRPWPSFQSTIAEAAHAG